MNYVVTGFIDEDDTVRGLPIGVPLETPLTKKRRRCRYVSSPEPTASNSLTADGATSIKDQEIDSTTFLQAPVTTFITTPSTSREEFIIKRDGSDNSSPQKTRKTFSHNNALKKEKFDFVFNYGSEEDSECETSSDYEDVEEEADFDSPGFQFLNDCKPEPAPKTALSQPSATPYEPSDLFNFEWRTFPNPPVPPTERREVFSEINCGPTAPFRTPYDAFIAIWDRDFMEYIASETNRYAQEVVENMFREGSLAPTSRINCWYETNADELYVFFALILATGMCVKAELTDYWSTGDLLSTPNFKLQMPQARFLMLSRCLHFNKKSPDVISRLGLSQAKLHKIAPVIDHLNSRFQSLYRLDRNIVIDESLTQWKGLLNIKQFIKHKTASVGIKTYEICETETGYLWRFKVHTGREEVTERETTPVSGTIATLVLELLSGLEYKGHTVWMDNYYNSPPLARTLKSLGFDCVGTLRTNRNGVPKQLATLTKSEMAVGQISGCTSGDVDVFLWRDQNRVAMISTYHGAAVHTAHDKTKPIAVHDYNVCMGGVDKKDQMLSMYPMERKRTHIWYKKFFRRLLNVSVLNAFILYKKCVIPDKCKRITTHRDFRKTLCTQLIENHKARDIFSQTELTKVWKGPGRKIRHIPIFGQEVLKHFPAEYGFIPGSTTKERMRRSCVVCRKRVRFYCPACDVPLCLECSKIYHK